MVDVTHCCGTCNLARGVPTSCRARPPTVVVIPTNGGTQVASMYPAVGPDDWGCTEWEAEKVPLMLVQ